MKRGQRVQRSPGGAIGLLVDLHADKTHVSVRVPSPVPRPPFALGPREVLVRWRLDEVEVV